MADLFSTRANAPDRDEPHNRVQPPLIGIRISFFRRWPKAKGCEVREKHSATEKSLKIPQSSPTGRFYMALN
jgi:hypothetical protein